MVTQRRPPQRAGCGHATHPGGAMRDGARRRGHGDTSTSTSANQGTRPAFCAFAVHSGLPAFVIAYFALRILHLAIPNLRFEI
jgi:hypothetical protein